MKKEKLKSGEALKLLEKYFKLELRDIYREIGKFRDGIKSLQLYSE